MIGICSYGMQNLPCALNKTSAVFMQYFCNINMAVVPLNTYKTCFLDLLKQ